VNPTDRAVIRIGPATSEEIRELRHQVLRPGRPLGVLDSPDDLRTLQYAAWDGGRVVGCVRILPAPWPGADSADPPEPRAWQLRSMAVDPTYQGHGIGGRLLAAIEAEARARTIPLLWANARTAALGFYRRAGWRVVGEEFVHPESGLPHFRIVLALGAGSPTSPRSS